MWTNKPTSDTEAFLQAILPFMQMYKIERQIIRGYTERGRVDNIQLKDTVNAFIQPGSKSINTNQEGKGRRITATYTLYTVVPEYVSIGDLIYTDFWGVLKVISIDDQRIQGVMQATLTRTGTTENSSRVDNLLYEPN